jgi:glycosyltransferase involved in cell wall biosynthesis
MKNVDKNLVWVTNIPVPYRELLWQRLSSEINFKIIFMSKTEFNYEYNPPKNVNYSFLGLRPFYIPTISTPLYFGWRKLYRLQIWERANVVYIDGWESPAYLINAWLWKRKGMKVIFSYRSTAATHRFNGRLALYLKGKILNIADSIITVGNSSTEAVLAAGVDRSKILQIFNPVDVSFFHAYSLANRVEPDVGHRFLFVGQLIERKNVKSLIHAFSKIARNGDTLSIAGDGILKNQLVALINDLKMNESVILVGQRSQDELAKIYANSDTLVMPSTEEVWGLVANEALASGMHAVVSEKSGVTDLISGMPGVYTCNTDIESIAVAMDKSREDFKEAVKQPEILKYTPERFADELLKWVMRR